MTSQTGQQTITVHILPNISRSEGNQTMKCCQLIEYSVRNIFLKKSCRKVDRWTLVDVNFITFQTVDRELCSVFSFYKGIWDQPLCHIFCIIFQENFFSFYILITEQISWSGCWVFFEMLDNIYLQLFAIQSMMK